MESQAIDCIIESMAAGALDIDEFMHEINNQVDALTSVESKSE